MKYILTFIIVFLFLWSCEVAYKYHEANKRELQKIEEERLLQERLNNMTTPQVIDYIQGGEDLKKLSFCESSYRRLAVHDGGKGVGAFGWHKTSFDWYTKDKMKENLDYNSTLDQARATKHAINNNYAWLWTCSHKVGII